MRQETCRHAVWEGDIPDLIRAQLLHQSSETISLELFSDTRRRWTDPCPANNEPMLVQSLFEYGLRPAIRNGRCALSCMTIEPRGRTVTER